jgi:hypothetical protein
VARRSPRRPRRNAEGSVGDIRVCLRGKEVRWFGGEARPWIRDMRPDRWCWNDAGENAGPPERRAGTAEDHAGSGKERDQQRTMVRARRARPDGDWRMVGLLAGERQTTVRPTRATRSAIEGGEGRKRRRRRGGKTRRATGMCGCQSVAETARIFRLRMPQTKACEASGTHNSALSHHRDAR